MQARSVNGRIANLERATPASIDGQRVALEVADALLATVGGVGSPLANVTADVLATTIAEHGHSAHRAVSALLAERRQQTRGQTTKGSGCRGGHGMVRAELPQALSPRKAKARRTTTPKTKTPRKGKTR